MRVAVGVLLGKDQGAGRVQPGDDAGVGLEDLQAGEISHLAGKSPPVVDRAQHRDPGRFAGALVVLAEPGRHLDDAGALVHRDEVLPEDHERAGGGREVLEERSETAPDELGTFHRADDLRAGEHLVIGSEAAHSDHDAAAVQVEHRVLEVRPDGEGEVRRQGPRCRRPGEHSERSPEQLGPVVDGFQVETDRHRRIDPVPVGVILASLEVRERRLAFPAVGEHPEPLVGEPFVVEALEGPHHALHEREVHRLVDILEVHPAGLAGDVTLPGVGGSLDDLAAVVVEPVDAVLDHRLAVADPELLLGLHLRRKAVAVPTEAPLDPAAAHRLIAGDGVLDEAGEEMAVMRQSVGERRSVVEDVFALGRVQGHGRLEGPVLPPEGKDLLLEGGIARLSRDLGVRGRAGRVGHGHTVGRHGR